MSEPLESNTRCSSQSRPAFDCRVVARESPDATELSFLVRAAQPVLLLWGMLGPHQGAWIGPPRQLWPAGTCACDDSAVQTPIPLEADGSGELLIRVPRDCGFDSLAYVFRFPDSDSWDNNRGRDYRVPLPARPTAAVGRAEALHSRVSATIIEAETGKHSWTLMHRFERCAELLTEVEAEPTTLVLLYVWLRYSAIRQLDWQRRYDLVPADYAFVVHTTNPLNGDPEQLYAEVVPGLGETLVGNFPGRALGFLCTKGQPQPQLVSYPSKSCALYGSGTIFRSDSNGEDLPGYAGAGLYESVTASAPEQVVLDYGDEPLVWEERVRWDLLVTIADLAVAVERVRGAPQDIEGAVSKGEYFLLQARPQVGL